MNIDGQNLTDSQRLRWLADHRNDDDLLAMDDYVTFNPVTWRNDSEVGGIEPLPRSYAPDPLADHPSDRAHPLPDDLDAARGLLCGFGTVIGITLLSGLLLLAAYGLFVP